MLYDEYAHSCTNLYDPPGVSTVISNQVSTAVVAVNAIHGLAISFPTSNAKHTIKRSNEQSCWKEWMDVNYGKFSAIIDQTLPFAIRVSREED